jgi:SAM-dependent methyltransferase
MSTFSPIAQTSFANSTAYDAHRPTYPAESVQHLLEQCRVAGKRGARIIDLAAGTGKFTEALAAREEGFEILAVEPHADMRKVLVERGLKGVKVVDGTAEDVPVENGWADAVFVAQVGLNLFFHSLTSSLFHCGRQMRSERLVRHISTHVFHTMDPRIVHNLHCWRFRHSIAKASQKEPKSPTTKNSPNTTHHNPKTNTPLPQ